MSRFKLRIAMHVDAVIGKFPLANAIYNDYLALEKNNLSTPAINALLTPNAKESRAERKRKRRALKKQSNLFRKKPPPGFRPGVESLWDF